MSVIDVEITLNRFFFGKIGDNKIQIGFVRISWWDIPNKYSLSFEINWKNEIRKTHSLARPDNSHLHPE